MNNREVAHLWNAQSRQSAKGSHFYFEGPTIYSYGAHFPIATIHTRKARDGMPDSLVLFTERRYSVTTSKHISFALSACGNRHVVFVPHTAPRCHGDHVANLNALAQRQTDALKQAQRRASVWRVNGDRERATTARDDYARYCTFFGIKRKPLPMMETEFNAAASRAERIENPDPASADKRERARAQRIERNRARDEYLAEQRRSVQAAKRARDFYRVGAARSSFRLGGAWGEDYEALRSSPCMLRVNHEKIETSWGARVPAAAARKVWDAVRWGMTAAQHHGRPTSYRGIKRFVIGDYALDQVDADGTMHAGCHVIPYSELSAAARMLGVQS